MSQLGSVYRREFWSYFRTPIAYVFITAFNVAAIIITFFIGGLLDTNQADLNPFFTLLPWMMLCLVPGVGMRLWAEEKSAKTLELTLTLPIKLWTSILGKFLAGWTIIGLALGLTFPLIVTVFYLGEPDAGALVCGYLGGMLMAGAFLAVSTFCSVISKSQVVSFVLSLVANLTLLIVGWGVFTDVLLAIFPLSVVDAIAYLGVITHFDGLGRGVIPFQDVVYFLTLIASSLLLSFFILTQQRATSAGKRFETFVRMSSMQQIALTFGLGLALIALSALIPFRLDLTANKSYSISEHSRAIVKALDRDVEATLYFSQSMRDTPPFIKLYGKRVADVLGQYAKTSGGRITFKMVDPRPDSKEEDQAIHDGLTGVKVRDGAFYFGISMKSGTKESSVPFLDPGREDLLEYEIAKALVATKGNKKPVLGVLSSLKVSNTAPDGTVLRWTLLDQLEGSFEIQEMKVLTNPVPDNIDALLLIHPKDWDRSTFLAIDQFVMRGGKVVMAVDPFARMEIIQKYGVPIVQAGGDMVQASSQPQALFKEWGIQFDPTKVVGDPNRAVTINIYGQSTLYPLFVKLGPSDFSASPVLKNLKEIVMAEGGSVSLAPGSSLTMEPLLQSSEESGTAESFVLAFQDAKKTLGTFKPARDRRVFAALFRGTFKSAFATDDKVLKESKTSNELIVVADADFLEDRHATRMQNIGEKQVRAPKNDNINLILNSLEYLTGNGSLMAIRSSGVISRPFTTLRDLQKATELRWREEEQKLQGKVHAAQNQLSSFYTRDSKANRLDLRPEELKVIKKLRQEERDMENKYRNVRRNLREEIQQLNHRLIAYNVVAAPILVLCFGLLYYAIRFRQSKQGLRMKRLYLMVPALTTAAALVFGFVHFEQREMRLNAAPLFETLFDMEKLSDVQQVTLTENGEIATIIKGPDGIWRLKESNMQPVNSDRLSRLLYDFSEAKIVRTINGSKGNAESFGLNQGKSIAFDGGTKFKLVVGKQQAHGGYIVQEEGKDHPILIDQMLHTNTNPAFWLQTPPATN